ncbi:MAG: MarR family transcriptional regulator [Lapillicoccus sp.]
MPTTRQSLVAQLGGAMQAYQRSTQAFDDQVGRRLGLNPTDLRCLDWLVDQDRSARELAEATGLSSAATTAMIDRLEARGFVRRTRGDADRRKVIVSMTPEGRARTNEFYLPLVMEGMDILDRLTVAELRSMVTHLVAIRDLTDRHRRQLAEPGSPSGPTPGRS